MKFKIIFPGGYQVENILDDNIDINVILENMEVYFATFFTVKNIKNLLQRSEENYFWATDMVIVENLRRRTIRDSVCEILKEGNIANVLSNIGTYNTVYARQKVFNEVVDMSEVASIRDFISFKEK